MKERLPKDLTSILKTIEDAADEAGVQVFVVGGFVRDLLLNIENLDIDIVVEGDGIVFASYLGKKFHGRVKSHSKFGTSVVILPDGFRIDVATARMEFYKHPAALPIVEKSSIESDLFRRDFTVNSLAIKLNGKEAFCLIDFFNGERDLKEGILRVLHNLSFIDDPCRIFRAIRFEQRYRFTIGKQTQSFMKNAIQKGLVDQLSGSRLLNELKLILNEKNPIKCVRRMDEYFLLKFLAPGRFENPESNQAFERLEEVLSWSRMMPFSRKPETWFVYFFGLFYGLNDDEFQKAVFRLRLPVRLKNRLQDDRVHCQKALRVLKKKADMAPSEIYDLFSMLSLEAVIFLLALCANERSNQYATLYFSQYHASAKLSLSGADLIQMGMKPGPVFQTVFKTLRDARINGVIKSRNEEMALVRKQFLNP